MRNLLALYLLFAHVCKGLEGSFCVIRAFSGLSKLISIFNQAGMLNINNAEEDRAPILNHKAPCLHSSNLVRCTCDDVPDDESENSPLISLQNHSIGNDTYLTDIHCHEAKPIYSNAKARRKLLIASILCLLFVVAEVVGKLSFSTKAVLTYVLAKVM